MRLALAFCLVAAASACSTNNASSDDSGADAPPAVIDVCDAFSGVGTACPLASPVRCFPACDAGGCYCSGSEDAPTWSCVTDLSCVPDCGPLDDGCGGGEATGDAGGG